jgi:hypothetical protein
MRFYLIKMRARYFSGNRCEKAKLLDEYRATSQTRNALCESIKIKTG